MANNHAQCEMCCEEEAVGCCNICGNICESCCVIHKKGRAFQNHILKMYGKDGYNSRSIIYDITEEICKHHPTEVALLFCKIHELMICGRCFRSDHISCGHEVVDLCQEAEHIDYDQTNDMSAALNEIKDDSMRMKEEIDRQKERSYTHAVKCNKELDDLKNRLKRKVEHSISTFKEEAQKLHDENIAAFSFISSVCDDKVSWAIKEESQLNEFVNNSLTGRLYLLNRNFDKGISEVKRQMKEAKFQHTFKQFCLKESTVVFKCLTEDLRDVCELQEEVDGSDEGTTFSIKSATQETQKTRKELIEALIQAKRDVDKAETKKNEIEKELLQAKQGWANSEKTKDGYQHELLNVIMDLDKSEQGKNAITKDIPQCKQGWELAEKARQNVKDELERTKKELDLYQKERAILQAHFKDHLNWTQPTGRLEVTINYDTSVPFIKLDYTFQDGLQTRNHPRPGYPYKGDTFTVRLRDDNESRLACMMLKAAFRKGWMFIIGTDGMVVMDGHFQYNGPIENINYFGGDLNSVYVRYIKMLTGELADKGITDADIDEADNLEETFTVESLSLLEAALSTVEIADKCIGEAN
ncbi:uncharacterized protein LOC128240108 [Mya arenaria]|uniref:uncharacterized protein LOC128240108 n=1 Tax=Mya arenaria TaxID=6604 RepID=UPI0022E7FB54|nr:uncharacterized protein LOC128240108 [Mya arenaria]